ncbi:putative bifunctional diguanylate cyclase/phosphodiesterase [Gynuella sunshinyii]|uniref:Putative signal transduction protein containing a membrane domain, an EAL and a GGDEF domain n=1 Tax=Gynuella sunshinyii YC6258 TaxID=1445510 RepID=A0A0C5VAL8_9GAMM|nr:EAL domain-containing protein [Gynuella sunshinyii]AJQ96375.1 putative signal transduction protein containing a membrane domain, an EAL and a GGDEF domain [Gynuella sunshinyii YC6258]
MYKTQGQGQHADVWPLADEFESQVRAMQIQSVVRITPLIACVNIFNAAILSFVFWSDDYRLPLATWNAVVLFVCLKALLAWFRTRGRQMPMHASRRAIGRANTHATLLAVLWALPAAFLFGSSTPEQQLLLSSVTVGMMCGGALILSNIAFAGTAYSSIVGFGGMIALLSSNLSTALPLAVLLLIYIAVLDAGVIHLARIYRARIVAELLAENQKQVISLLLNDFEQHTADVLLEMDSHLKFRRASDKLAAFFRLSETEIIDHSLIELIAGFQKTLRPETRAAAQQSLAILKRHFTGQKAFRDIEFPVQRGEEEFWWSLTARPIGSVGWRGVISDITVARNAQQHIWHLAHSDAITGLGNRHQFQHVLREMFPCMAGQSSQMVAVLCIDLDRFKSVNDAYGHNVGDKLLSFVGRRLAKQSREQDLVARIGGDEFGIVLKGIGKRVEAEQIAERILEKLQEPCNIDGNVIHIGASLGLALAPVDGDRPEILLKHADMALYAAKADGRGRMRSFSASISEQVEKKLVLENALRTAIQNNELYLVYQPQQHLKTGLIEGFEALLRWEHPEFGKVTPSVFIPVAEESGLIREIGLWVIEQACMFSRLLPSGMRVAVNLSPLQLVGHDLIDRLQDILERYDIPADRLEFEVTESMLINSASDMDILTLLKAMGIRIALDDFGTGYSALSYLRQFPFDKLKIDRSFMKEIKTHQDALAVVGAIIDMAKALDMEVVAEGIEDEQTLKLLTLYGCDTVQGYVIARPMPEKDIAVFLENYRLAMQ